MERISCLLCNTAALNSCTINSPSKSRILIRTNIEEYNTGINNSGRKALESAGRLSSSSRTYIDPNQRFTPISTQGKIPISWVNLARSFASAKTYKFFFSAATRAMLLLARKSAYRIYTNAIHKGATRSWKHPA